jgi:DNA-binding MarR family transcriptional regulator
MGRSEVESRPAAFLFPAKAVTRRKTLLEVLRWNGGLRALAGRKKSVAKLEAVGSAAKRRKKEEAPESEVAAQPRAFLELPEAMQNLWYGYIKAYKVVTEAVDRDLKQQSLMSLADYEVVASVESAGGRLRFIDLAKLTLLSQSRISRQVDALQTRGLLRRETTDTDRRATYALLMPKGKEELEKAAQVVVAALRAHFYDRIPTVKQKLLQELLDDLLEPGYRAQSGRIINDARVVNGLPPIGRR